jgi:hypothetical protein
MKGVLERSERGRDCGRGGVVQMWKGEDGIGVASSVEDDHDDDDEEEEEEGEDEYLRRGDTRQLPFPNPRKEIKSKTKSPPPPSLTSPCTQLRKRYRRVGEFYTDGQGCYVCVCVFFLFSFLLSPSLSLLSFKKTSC